MSLDPQCIRSAIDTRLPRHARWMIGRTPLDFDFSAERYPLRRLTERDMGGGSVPTEWSDCLVFGGCDFAEGGGAFAWIAIRERDGFVCGLDIERSAATLFVFNSSLDGFIRTFRLLDPHLRGGRELPADMATRAMALDSEVFSVSDWKQLIDFVSTR